MAIVYGINTRGSHSSLRSKVERGLAGARINSESFRGRRVLIKPNLCGPSTTDHLHAMTDPRLVAAITEIARTHGAADIIVADHSADYVQNPQAFYQAVGLTQFAESLGVRLLDLRQQPFNEVEGLRLSSIVGESDVIVNLALPKTHHQSDVTLCSKNLAMGLVNGRAAIHRGQSLAEVILRANEVIARGRTIINILDGRYGQEGLGPHFGDKINPGFMLFGSSARAVDVVGARLMGFDPSEIRHLRTYDNQQVLELGNDIPVTAFKRSPRWEFVTNQETGISHVFWLDEKGIGHLREYSLDPAEQRYRLRREVRVHFNDPEITKDRADRFIFDEGGIAQVLSSKHDDFHAHSPFSIQGPVAEPHLTKSVFNDFNLWDIASEIEHFAKRSNFVIQVEESGLFFDDSFLHETYAPQLRRPISQSRELARQLQALHIDQIRIHRSTSAEQFRDEIERVLYRKLTSIEKAKFAGSAVLATGVGTAIAVSPVGSAIMDFVYNLLCCQ